VKTAKAGKLNPPGEKTVTPEPMELSRVRAENVSLRILKKASGHMARPA
jgi:transposase-like protein